MRRTGALILVLTGALLLLGGKTGAFGQDGPERLQNVGLLNVEAVTDEVMQTARSAVMGPDEAGKDGPLAAVGMELAVLYHQHRVAGANGVQALRAPTAARPKTSGDDRLSAKSRTYSPLSADGEFVTVDVIASEGSSRLLADLRRLGLENGAMAGNVVSGRLPISAIKDAAGLSSLRGMKLSYARTSVGSVGSEADTAHAANTARLNTGTDGSGQKVCALSDSYDTAGTSPSASDDVNSGDLPGQGNPEGRTTPVDVRQEYDGSDPEPTDEGRAMLQLIHDIAPGATLGFHTAFGGIANFVSGIQDLAGSGCTIIVDDVRYFAEPFYQDGPVSNAVDDVVSNSEVAYFSSAGNDGRNSYEASFRNSGEPGVLSSGSFAHDFDSGPNTDTRQEITIEPDGTFQITFQWTDPSALVQGSEGANTDFDIVLVDENDNVVAQSADDNISNGLPFEFLEYTNDDSSAKTLFLVIEQAAENGTDDDEVKYIYGPFNGGFQINEYETFGPTLFGHPMADSAMAVAAAPFYYTEEYCSRFPGNCFEERPPPYLEPFSSLGGIPILFEQDGDERSAVIREKPDVTAADGIDNTFFQEDLPSDFLNGVDTDPHPNFFGTSAAAPSVAAIAALIRQARPVLSPHDVYRRLDTTAADVTQRINENSTLVPIASGKDPWSGAGFVQAEPAVPAVDVAITNATAEGRVTGGNDGAVDLTWRQVGGEEEATLDAFVIRQGYFEEGQTERVRVESNGAGEYMQTITDLPVGTHRFRIQGVAETGAGTDSLVVEGSAQVTLRSSEVNVIAYPNPFRDQVNLSVTFPKARNGRRNVRVDVFDLLGRRVATPILSQEIGDSESIDLGGRLPESLGSGVYFFRVWNENMTATTRAVRVR